MPSRSRAFFELSGYRLARRNASNKRGAHIATAKRTLDLVSLGSKHGHNGYLDIALTTGFPGLFLCVAFLVIGPIISYHRYNRNKSSRVAPEMTALSTFLLQIWLFGIYFNCFESALFDRGNRVWFLMCSAVFGLYYMSRFPLLNEPCLHMREIFPFELEGE